LNNLEVAEANNENKGELFRNDSEIDDDEDNDDNESNLKTHNDCLNVIKKYKNALYDESE
jgi:hypothetical protein